ncbi:MAG: beta-eliminating lyase-related protein [Pseudomonadota bacterium]
MTPIGADFNAVNFSSDTSAPAHLAVIEALARVNSGMEGSYGGDSATGQVRELLKSALETDDFEFWLCASGTASNALALSVMCSPTGSILCHREAHIERDERGAPEFFTGGAKLHLLDGPSAQIDETALRDALGRIDREFVHETPPDVLSLTNLTESGTAYSVEKIAHYAQLAKAAGLRVHLDGARLANALVSTGASLADMTWRAGVDVVTLGLTKTGAIGCEIIILFGDMRGRYKDLLARAKRSGHMPPKMRFIAAQAEALLSDGLWLDLAAMANSRAREFSNIICSAPGVSLAHSVDGNEVFAVLPPEVDTRLRDAGGVFYPWIDGSHRFVCSWATPQSDLDALRAVLAG